MEEMERDTMTQTIKPGVLGILYEGQYACLHCASMEEILAMKDSILVTRKMTYLVRPDTSQYCERMTSDLCLESLW